MATEEPGRAQASPLTSLPRTEDLPLADRGYDPERVREAFEAFRRHVLQLQTQLRVLQAAGGARVEPSGHAVRMDALHLIRQAAEFADKLERDAQDASAAQLARTEELVGRRQRELVELEASIERFREESERQRGEIVSAAKNESREILAKAHREASQELREAEARGNRLLEQSRHQATELTNAVRAEVEQTLEWARTQASAVISRAQQGAEQLLAAAGLGSQAMTQVVAAIVQAAEAATATTGRQPVPPRPVERIAGAPPVPVEAEPMPPVPEEPPLSPPEASGGAGGRDGES